MEAGLWLLHGHQRRKSKGEMMLWNQEGGGDSSGTHLTFCLETSVDDSNIVHSTQ